MPDDISSKPTIEHVHRPAPPGPFTGPSAAPTIAEI